MRYLKENTATRVTVGPFLDVGDAVTPETALTVTACHLTFMVDDAGVPTLVIDAAPTASGGSNDMVHVTSDIAGFYDLELTAAQTNYTGRAMLMIHDTDVHLPVFHEFQIVSANVYDSLFTDGDVLDVNVTQWLGTAAATPTTAGVPEVDVTHLGGATQSATDLKDFADAGYDPATNKVQGVVLCDTTTTNTDMVGAAPTAAAIVNEWETQSQADPTGFHVNVLEVGGTAQTANDNGADINTLVTQVGTAGAGLTDLGGMSTAMKAEVNVEVVDSLATDTYTEPGQEAPGVNVSLSTKIGYLYKAWRNRSTQTSDTFTLYADDTTTVDQKASVSDDATTATKGEIGTGP